jgi:Sigma-70 region 2
MMLTGSSVAGEMPGPAIASIVASAGEQPAASLVSLAVRLAQAGDRDALGFLYARYADDVYDCARIIVGDPQDAKDVTQQVFATLVHMIDEYDMREVPFLLWILRLARDLATELAATPAR